MGTRLHPNVLFNLLAQAANRFPTDSHQAFLKQHEDYQPTLRGDGQALARLKLVYTSIAKVASSDPERVPRKNTTSVRVRGLQTAGDRVHADVYSDRVSQEAVTDWRVRHFRDSYFGNPEALACAAAAQLLKSPILRFMSKSELDALGIPTVGHSASVIRTNRGSDANIGHWDEVRIKVDWPGGHWTESRRLPTNPRYAISKRVIDTFKGGQASIYGLLTYRFPYLTYPSAKGRLEQRVLVHPGSVFDMLRRCAESLADRTTWSSHDATWFVVSGVAPRIESLRAGRKTHEVGVTYVTIVALPSTSRASVSAAFALASQRGKGRPVAASTGALVRFVEAKTEAGAGVRPTWSSLMRDWNQERPPGWRRFADFRAIRRTYDRAVKRRSPRQRITRRK